MGTMTVKHRVFANLGRACMNVVPSAIFAGILLEGRAPDSPPDRTAVRATDRASPHRPEYRSQ